MFARSTTAIVALVAAPLAAWLCASRTPTAWLVPNLTGPLAVTADLNSGGLDDSAVLRGDAIEVTLSEQHIAIELPALPGTTALVADDIDHDGDLDLVSLGRDGLREWINRGAGSFAAWTVTLSSSPIVPVQMRAVHWSPMAPAFLSIATGRPSLDAMDPARVATVAPLVLTATLAAVPDRAPPQTGASNRSPRAPPQTFLS